MFIAMISWWYSKGLAWRAEKILSSIEKLINTFSLGLLIKTWFAPFRQIDAVNAGGGSLDVRLRRALDKLFSRFVGAFLRTFMMIFGVFFITIKALWGILNLLIWLAAPILPIVFVVLFTTNWTPNWLSNLRSEFSKINSANSTQNIQQESPPSSKSIFNFGG